MVRACPSVSSLNDVFLLALISGKRGDILNCPHEYIGNIVVLVVHENIMPSRHAEAASFPCIGDEFVIASLTFAQFSFISVINTDQKCSPKGTVISQGNPANTAGVLSVKLQIRDAPRK